MYRVFGLIVILGAAALGGCSSDVTTFGPPIPDALTIVAGDNQSVTVVQSLLLPLEVAVTTAGGIGVADITVEWTVMTGGGAVSTASTLTGRDGRASVTWTLGPAVGAQSATATVTGLRGSPVSFSASATRVTPARVPLVLHYDGSRWTTALEENYGAGVALTSVWGATASKVFAVGGSCAGGIILGFDGSSWALPPSSCVGGSLNRFTSVWGSSGSDVFATERNGIPPKLGGAILHYDGQQWTSVYAAPCGALGILCPAFQAGWSSGPADAFAVGDGGLIARYDGTTWNPHTSGVSEVLNGVWGVGPAGVVFAVGAAGTILTYDRSAWHAQTSGTTQPLYAVWGTAANDIFAVGGAGTILHYNGIAWTAQSSGTTQSLYAIWGTSGNAVFAVGDGSTILHYDGTSWTPQTTGASMKLRGLWGSSATSVFAVGWPQ
jgi:hypothetical protein